MKFATALIAIGAQAVKLTQEEDDYVVDRYVALHRITDWDGSGTVDAEEIKDFAYIAEAFGYIDEDELYEAYDGADELIEAFGGPFTVDELVEVLDYALAEGGEEVVDEIVGGLEDAEELIIDAAVGFAFDAMDADMNGEIDEDEVYDMIDELELDDEEAEEVLDGFDYADADGDEAVDAGEFYDAVWEAVENDVELRNELMQGVADLADEFDVDCSADGVEGCDDERAEMLDEIDAMAESDSDDDETLAQIQGSDSSE